ncbi:GDSL-type esterase/lipase family protein [Micromonospora sp. NPDC048986]|uniref:GDSL-type esterase/lipase family protein n=1 Tax=Micromonospora sp. NPDC048986 TaxID=3155644 RepID=UPI00340C4598
MPRIRTLLAALTAVAVTLTVAGSMPAVAAPAPLDTSQHLRILAIGDSITRGVGSPTTDGYRAYLTSYLVDVGQYTTTDMVGGLVDGLGPQPQHEGHGGWRIDQLTAEAAGWVTTYDPDVVLVMGGTNDALQGASATTMGNRLRGLLAAILTTDPTVRVIVADLIPPYGSDQKDTASLLSRQFNAQIQAIADAASPRVSVARMTRAVPSRLLADGVHPDDEGYERMAWVWWQCLGPILTADGITRTGRDPLPQPVPQTELCTG